MPGKPLYVKFAYPCFIGALSALVSCQYPHYYRPKPQEPVLLTHSGQVKANAVTDNDNFNAVSIAWSPKEHLGLSAGMGILADEGEAGESYFNPYLSAGYYTNFSKNILLEIYSGLGLYRYENKDEAEVQRILNVNYFVQPSLAFMHRNIEVAFTLRADYLKRYRTLIASPPDMSDIKFGFLNHHDYFFIQPGCTVRFGFKYFKFQFQVAKSNPLSDSYASIYGLDYYQESGAAIFDNPVKCSSGITLDIDVFKKKKQD